MKSETGNTAAGVEALGVEAQQAVQVLGKVIHSASIYGMEHRATVASIDEAYSICSEQIAASGRMNFAIRNNALLLGGKLADNSHALVRQLCRKMISKNITAFSIVKGMGLDEFKRLVDLLSNNDKSDFDEQLRAGGLEHVSSEKVQLREVAGDEEVVAAGGATSDIRDLAEQWLAGQGEDAGTAGQGAGGGVEQIVAFLKGDVSPDDPGLQDELARAAEDTDKLAQLIMDAAVVRQTQSNIQSGESVADLVIGCLRRTYEGIRKKMADSEKRGDLELKKTFMLLEKNIIDKLHRLTGSSDPAVDDEIRAAIAEMEQELELDSIASDYMQQREMLQRNEKRIAEYIKSDDGKGLEERLMNAGMAPESWRSLVARSGGHDSGAGGGAGTAGDFAAGFGALAVVLAKFDELMSSTTPSAPEVEQFIEQIEGHIAAAEEDTHRRIDTLSEQVQNHVESEELGLSDPEQQQIRAHRKQFSIFVERLAELAQELMQPLTVINCSIKMTTSGYVGEVSEEQKDLLDLAQSSANRLNRLIERLTTLVGYPKELNPKTSELDEGAF